jgi:hypothetical protein
MIFFIILTSLTIWITIKVLVIGLCFAARLGDLQFDAVYALPASIHHRAPRHAAAGRRRSRQQGCSRASRAMLLDRALRSRRAAPPGAA